MDDICKNRHGGADTSVAANESAAPSARKIQRDRILEFIRSKNAEGVTCEEVEQALGLRHQTASARIAELRRDDEIAIQPVRRATKSGCTARVYRTTL